MIRGERRAVFRSHDLPWPITSREIVCHNNHRRHWRQHIFSKKQYHMTFELIMDSKKNIFKIKSQHHDGCWTSKVRPSTMKVCPRKCLYRQKIFKKSAFWCRGPEWTFSTGAKTISNQTSSSAKICCHYLPQWFRPQLTKDSVKCTLGVEINCPICRELKGSPGFAINLLCATKNNLQILIKCIEYTVSVLNTQWDI